MFVIRNEGKLTNFHPVSKRMVFAKTQAYGSVFVSFPDYTIRLKENRRAISIWSNCRALKILAKKQYKNDLGALKQAFKGYNCMICSDPYSTFYSTMIFVSERRIVFLLDDGTIKKFRLTGNEKDYFEIPTADGTTA